MTGSCNRLHRRAAARVNRPAAADSRRKPRQYERLEGVDLWELEPGMHCDGAGLYLRVDWDGGRRWSFIYHRRRRREMSLGPLRDLPLEGARAAACRARCQVRGGGDPIQRKREDGSHFRLSASLALPG